MKMNEVEVFIDGCEIAIKQYNDVTEDYEEVRITTEQAELFVLWVRAAARDIDENFKNGQ